MAGPELSRAAAGPAAALAATPQLPSRKPEPPESVAARLRQGAAVAARRAQAGAGRQEMIRAALGLFAAPDDAPAGLPAAVKAETGAAMAARLSEARRAGLGEDDLARLEAELGAHQLLLLERGLAEQAARLRAQAAGQLEAEAGALVAAVLANPARAFDAVAALDELFADFAPGVAPEVLSAFGEETRAALAAAEVEGHIAAGDPKAAAAALEAIETLPAPQRARLELEIAAERARRPMQERLLAGTAAQAGIVRSGRAEGLSPAGLAVFQEAAAPGLRPHDPRARQLAQAGADDAGGFEDPRGPSEREINDFLSETGDLSDAAFRDAAAGFGLDPEMAALFRDMLRVTPETEAEVRQRIRTLLPFGFGAPRNEIRTVLDQILMTEDAETRQRLIEPQLKFGRADRDLAADAAAGGFRSGATRPTRQLGITQGGGRKGRGSKPGEDGDPEAPRGGRPRSPGGAGLSVGQPDPVLTKRTVVQPVEGRRRLLEMAAEAKPDFDRQLEDIARSVPGTKLGLSRIKEDGDRLTSKIEEFQKEMRKAGVEPASPDSGAHLIRDYLAGRLIPENHEALQGVLARVRKDFVVVDEKDFMKKPKPLTGYSAIHLQLRHKNGLTVELQVQGAPFKKAADAQREIFEKYRDFGDDIPDALWSDYKRDQARSREVFERAWREWLGAGNKDPRVEK